MAADEEGVDESLFPSKADLQEAEQLWGEGIEEANKPRPLGIQVADVMEADLGRSGSGRLQIHYHLQIKGGQFNEYEMDKYDGLGSPQQASITQQQLKKLGLNTDKLTVKTLPAALLTVKDKRMQIMCKQNGDFYNISFTKPVSESLTAPAANTSSGGRRQPAPAAAGGKRRF